MTQTQHTPGPWSVTYTGIWSKDARIADYRDNGHREVYRQLMPDEQEANAHLIAAAPDLLKVLERVDSAYRKGKNIDSNDAAFIGAAIARARGQL